MTRVDCKRCHGEGERTFNPSWPFDPEAENSEMCRTCQGKGYLDLNLYDADQDEWAERSPYSDFPRRSPLRHHIETAPRVSPSSPQEPGVASPVTSGRGEHLSDAA